MEEGDDIVFVVLGGGEFWMKQVFFCETDRVRSGDGQFGKGAVSRLTF